MPVYIPVKCSGVAGAVLCQNDNQCLKKIYLLVDLLVYIYTDICYLKRGGGTNPANNSTL